MRVLFLSQGKTIADHPGWHDALVQLQKEGFISDFKNIPFKGYGEQYGWEAFYKEVVRLCKEEVFDVVYFHHFHAGKTITVSPAPCMQALKSLAHRPIVITSVGDLFSYNWMRPHYPDHFKEASRNADITFSTQVGKSADKMISWGANNIVLSPLGMCQKRFKAFKHEKDTKKAFDLVFVGSRGKIKRINPLSKAWLTSIKRTKVVKELHNYLQEGFGLYGHNWNLKFSQGPIPFHLQQETFRKGRFAIDAPAMYCSDYYTSNRHLFQIASAVPTIMFETPRVKTLYRENDHLYYINNKESMIEQLESLFKMNQDELIDKANKAAEYIVNKHTQYHRMQFKLDTVKRFKANNYTLDVKFPFFLPEVDLQEEMKFAIRTRD